MNITVYTLENRDGEETALGFYSQDYTEARDLAITEKARVIANVYEFDDSYMVDDFTEEDEEDESE